MTIVFPRDIPDIDYAKCEVTLRDGVTASPSGGGLINYTQVAPPTWEALMESYPLDYQTYSSAFAWWLSLRGGLRSVLFRQPHHGYPAAHQSNRAPAEDPGNLVSVTGGNVLSVNSIDAGLALGSGDLLGLERAGRFYAGRVTEVSGSGTTRTITVEPPPFATVAQAGAVVRFANPAILMRPVPDSFQATAVDARVYTVSFKLVESA